MRRIFSNLLFVLATAGLMVGIASIPLESSYRGKARLVQRMRIDEASALFGEPGTPVGSPQRLIIEDGQAFTGSKTADGAEIVDEGYLEKNKIYPLQLQTVTFVAGWVRVLGFGFAVAGFLVGWWVRKRLK